MTDIREKIAFTVWRNEAVRAAPNVVKHRTPEAFSDESSETRDVWLGHADAIIAALPEMVKPLDEIERLRGALTQIERIYYTEGKDCSWRAAHMNATAYEAMQGGDQ